MKTKDIQIKDMKFQVVFRSEPEGGFTVFAPALSGCVTYGKNLKQARKMICEAITLYLEDMLEEKESLPGNNISYISDIEISLPIKSPSLVNA